MTKKKKPVVTRIAYSYKSNTGKIAALTEQASRLGVVRSRVWQDYGSLTGVWMSDRDIRDGWMQDGISYTFGTLVPAKTFGTLANPWKETVRDAKGDIEANQAAAKVKGSTVYLTPARFRSGEEEALPCTERWWLDSCSVPTTLDA